MFFAMTMCRCVLQHYFAILYYQGSIQLMKSHVFNVSVNRYKFLDSKFVGKSLSVVLPKLAADALLVTPVNLTLFYVGK